MLGTNKKTKIIKLRCWKIGGFSTTDDDEFIDNKDDEGNDDNEDKDDDGPEMKTDPTYSPRGRALSEWDPDFWHGFWVWDEWKEEGLNI